MEKPEAMERREYFLDLMEVCDWMDHIGHEGFGNRYWEKMFEKHADIIGNGCTICHSFDRNDPDDDLVCLEFQLEKAGEVTFDVAW